MIMQKPTLVYILLIVNIFAVVMYYGYKKHENGAFQATGSPKHVTHETDSKKMQKIICAQDVPQINNLMMFPDSEAISQVSMDHLYRIFLGPIQSACNNMKILGGTWDAVGWNHGKYVCLDDILESSDPCIIYSFGVGPDVTFEHAFMKYGCVIHSYDHTITVAVKEQFENPANNYFIHLQGVGLETKDNLTSLEDALAANGHEKSKITYLKVDIEGAEDDLIPHWLESGLMDNVQQFGVEFHDVLGGRVAMHYKALQEFYKKGFKLISYDPNYWGGFTNGRHTYFEAVLRKVRTVCEFDQN